MNEYIPATVTINTSFGEKVIDINIDHLFLVDDHIVIIDSTGGRLMVHLNSLKSVKEK